MSKQAAPGVRDRIMAVASDLFYRQGYRATGINQVIAESGVAKASFYDHFPSKLDLLHAYAEEMSRREFADLQAEVLKLPSARARFFGPLDVLSPWFEVSEFRGCPFQNMVAEATAEEVRVHEISRQYREKVRMFLRSLAEDLKKSEPKLRRLSAEELADTYLVLFEGAIVLSTAYRDPWPVAAAKRSLTELLKRA